MRHLPYVLLILSVAPLGAQTFPCPVTSVCMPPAALPFLCASTAPVPPPPSTPEPSIPDYLLDPVPQLDRVLARVAEAHAASGRPDAAWTADIHALVTSLVLDAARACQPEAGGAPVLGDAFVRSGHPTWAFCDTWAADTNWIRGRTPGAMVELLRGELRNVRVSPKELLDASVNRAIETYILRDLLDARVRRRANDKQCYLASARGGLIWGMLDLDTALQPELCALLDAKPPFEPNTVGAEAALPEALSATESAEDGEWVCYLTSSGVSADAVPRPAVGPPDLPPMPATSSDWAQDLPRLVVEHGESAGHVLRLPEGAYDKIRVVLDVQVDRWGDDTIKNLLWLVRGPQPRNSQMLAYLVAKGNTLTARNGLGVSHEEKVKTQRRVRWPLGETVRVEVEVNFLARTVSYTFSGGLRMRIEQSLLTLPWVERLEIGPGESLYLGLGFTGEQPHEQPFATATYAARVEAVAVKGTP